MSSLRDLALATAAALDPVAFCRRAGLEPEPWQIDVLRSEAARMLLLCARQSGKSSLSAILALREVLHRDEALALVVSPSERQSQELLRKVLTFYRRLGSPVPAESSTSTQLVLENGSRVVALPSTEAKIRGFSAPSLVICDEASRIEDAYWFAVLPMIASAPDARVVVASTPWGAGFFRDLWERGPDWERHRITADQVGHISAAALREAEATLPRWVYQQEYLCQFVDGSGESAFSPDVVAACIEEGDLWNLDVV